jgi:transposase
MAAPYSKDLRQRVISAYENGEGSFRDIAERFSVSLFFVWTLWLQYKTAGSVAPKPHSGGSKPKVDKAGEEAIKEIVRVYPDATLSKLCDILFEKTTIKISTSGMSKILKRLRLSRKKKTRRTPERKRDEIVKEREDFQGKQATMNSENLIFVDETSTHLNMSPAFARSPVGERAYADEPYYTGKNITLICALSLKGVIASFVIEGSADGDVFKTFISKVLAPVITPGKTILMDNVNFHKVDGVERSLIENNSKINYIPRYSPELNPIEEAFSKIKTLLRQIKARTFDELKDAISLALDKISQDDIIGWFRHAGYCIALE